MLCDYGGDVPNRYMNNTYIITLYILYYHRRDRQSDSKYLCVIIMHNIFKFRRFLFLLVHIYTAELALRVYYTTRLTRAAKTRWNNMFRHALSGPHHRAPVRRS